MKKRSKKHILSMKRKALKAYAKGKRRKALKLEAKRLVFSAKAK